MSNLDNFVELQNDVFTQNDNLSVFDDSYVENNHLEPKLRLVKADWPKTSSFGKALMLAQGFCILLKKAMHCHLLRNQTQLSLKPMHQLINIQILSLRKLKTY